MRFISLFILLLAFSGAFSQNVSLPYDFETSGTFVNFDGGTAVRVSNPAVGGINTSSRVGRMVRNGGQIWAGAYLTTTANVDFSVNPIICMKVYTTAPIGTNVSFKMEGCNGGCSLELASATTVTGAWETLYWDFSGAPTAYNRMVFLFDLGNVGNGSANSTFYFDDIHQIATIPLQLTPGSQYFCPTTSLNLTFPGSGTYNWYSAPTGGTLLQANSPNYTTPPLSGDTSYYVQDMTPTPFPATDLGPGFQGGTAIGNSVTVSTFFTSNVANGLFHSVDMVFHIPTGPPPSNTCTYRIDIFNITQGTSRSLTQAFPAPVNFSQHAFTFATPLPISNGDQMEMRITSITGHPCYCISSNVGANGSYLPFPSSFDPQITFTGHTSNGVPNSLMSGIDYNISGDFIDPTRSQVNAIATCPLSVDLLDFRVAEVSGNAVLDWITSSETNNALFKVRRSTDGQNFETIGTVAGYGQGTSIGANAYSFVHPDPGKGANYYQLEQVDLEGNVTLSSIVTLNMPVLNNLQLYPNPSTGIVTLRNSFEEATDIEVQVHDATGRTLATYQVTAESGTFQREIDLSTLPTGLYMIKVKTAMDKKEFRLLRI